MTEAINLKVEGGKVVRFIKFDDGTMSICIYKKGILVHVSEFSPYQIRRIKKFLGVRNVGAQGKV